MAVRLLSTWWRWSRSFIYEPARPVAKVENSVVKKAQFAYLNNQFRDSLQYVSLHVNCCLAVLIVCCQIHDLVVSSTESCSCYVRSCYNKCLLLFSSLIVCCQIHDLVVYPTESCSCYVENCYNNNRNTDKN